MVIKHIKIRNYKTYLSLDLDLSTAKYRPIILIGGMNGGGKTTLFEAICGALYGLKIADLDRRVWGGHGSKAQYQWSLGIECSDIDSRCHWFW